MDHASGLVVVFVALQLCAGLKYLHVGLIEIKIHHSQSKKSAGVSNKKGFDASLPPFCRIPDAVGTPFFFRDYQRAFERAAQGNLLLLETTVLPLYRDLSMRLSHGTLVTLLPLPMISKPLQKGYTLLKTSTDERLCGLPTLYRREDDAKLFKRASYYNHLHAVWPSVHFYVFPYLSWQTGMPWPVYTVRERSHTLPATGTCGSSAPFWILPLDTLGWRRAAPPKTPSHHYYRTDHHWNFPGRTRAIGNYGNCSSRRMPEWAASGGNALDRTTRPSSSTGLGPITGPGTTMLSEILSWTPLFRVARADDAYLRLTRARKGIANDNIRPESTPAGEVRQPLRGGYLGTTTA